MKEERLIGNSGVAEMRQQSAEAVEAIRQQGLQAVEEIRQTAGVLNEYLEVQDSDEFIDSTLDEENHLLEGNRRDGTKVFGGNVEVVGSMRVGGVLYSVINSSEYLAAWVDAKLNILFGIRSNGKTYVGDADFLDSIEAIKAFLPENLKDAVNWDALKQFDDIESDEFLSTETDENGNLLSSRNRQGLKKEYGGLETPNLSIDGASMQTYNDIEGRPEMSLDSERKILSYRKKDGTKVEAAGLETPNAKIGTLEVENLKSKNGDLVELTTKEYEYVERPKFAEFFIYNSTSLLPCDTNEIVIKVNNRAVLHANCSLEIQGHGSAGYQKKGYTIDFTNANGDELAVKFGNMIAVDSFHLKGYATDRTHARGIGGARFWRDFVRQLGTPYAKVNNIPFDMSADLDGDDIFISDANYCEDGFPVAVYVNDAFWGLHSLKLKKTRQNYAMQKSQKKEIFLDSISYNAHFNEPFDHTDWELKNPKLKKYEEGGEIPDAGVLADIERFFNFTSDIVNQKDDYADYMVLPHWIAWIIVSEIIGNRDTSGNNMNLLTWDGAHWTLIPYDLDLTLGLDPWSQQGYVIENSRNAMCANAPFFNTFRSLFEYEIKETYTRLRKSGFISVENIYKYYVDQVAAIPRDIQEKDKEKWENIWTNGYPTIEQIHLYLVNRIDYLDNLWLIQE